MVYQRNKFKMQYNYGVNKGMANFHGKFEIRIIKQAIPSHLEFRSNAIGESVTAGSLAEDIKADLRR